jgi:calcineurin-like phosphoesterase family protein
MNNVWFTADFHFHHTKIIDYSKRPFDDIEIMNETLISNYNDLVKSKDTVYILGDISLKAKISEKYLSRLNGNKIIIIGNHDVRNIKTLKKKYLCHDLVVLNIEKQIVVLCHYAMRTWDRSHYGSWNLHGHSHGTLAPLKNQWDVGVDNNDYKPISFEEIKEKFRLRSINNETI